MDPHPLSLQTTLMSVSNLRPEPRPLRRRGPASLGAGLALTLGASLPLVGLAGCNSTESAEQVTNTAGTYLADGGNAFFVDSNFGGLASALRISRQFFGRLVNIQAEDGQGGRLTLHTDFVIDPRAETGWPDEDYVLETNPVTGEQVLFIRANYNDTTLDLGELETGRDRFIRLLRNADAGTRAIADNGFSGNATFTMVPRNAAVVFVFDDLIDPSTVNTSSVQVLVGDPTVTPFEARVFLDQNHGDSVSFANGGEAFHSTRLVVDPAISERDSFSSSTSLSVNLLGFPASVNSSVHNAEIRFQTQLPIGQVQPLLQNLSQSPLASTLNGSLDFASNTRDVVRAFRSGGQTDVTGDPGNGFLFDDTAPRIVGSRAGVTTSTPVVVDAANLIFDIPELRFSTAICDIDPRVGDIVAQSPFFAEVLEANSVSDTGIVNNLRVRLVVTPDDFTGPEQYQASGIGPISYRTAYDPASDAALAFCFVETTPTAPDASNPTADVTTDVEFAVRFNEAIDPGPLEPYEGIALLRKDPALVDAGVEATTILPTDFIPGTITNDANLTRFTFRPLQNLTHVFGNSESYFFQLTRGEQGPRDLAGNLVDAVPSRVAFQIDANLPTQETGGRVIRFNSPDEEFPFSDPSGEFLAQLPRTEWFGNIDYDIVRGTVRPRSVVRSQVVVSQDPENFMVAQMVNGTGTSLPLNPLGARTQFCWRYLDVNLPLHQNRDIREGVDLSALDLDVEQILLNPLGSTPVFESFPEFSVSMSHSIRTPNEIINPNNRQLTDPGSGLTTNFDGNQLSLVEDAPSIVSARERGYDVDPGDRSVAADGTVLIPLAMNVGLPVEQWSTYTWRDTAIDARGGSSAIGTPVGRYGQLSGLNAFEPLMTMMGPDCNLPGNPNPLYDTGSVRTAGLPLMVDVKCYPTNGTSSQNQFGHAWAHVVPGSNPAVTSNLPGFRAYSAGGINQSGALRIVDPDNEDVARGGFDPTSTPPGNPLPGVDNFVYYGALDLVTRVSRMHSIFYPAYAATAGPDLTPNTLATDLTFSNPNYLVPLTVPAIQPVGTEVQFEYRVTRNIVDPDNASESTWAFRQDPYGDFYDSSPVNYTPPEPGSIPGVTIIGGASCFDGTFDYTVDAENPGAAPGFVNGSDAWSPNLVDVSGVEGDWIQVRVTFINNIATGQFPQLSALALSWVQD